MFLRDALDFARDAWSTLRDMLQEISTPLPLFPPDCPTREKTTPINDDSPHIIIVGSWIAPPETPTPK